MASATVQFEDCIDHPDAVVDAMICMTAESGNVQFLEGLSLNRRFDFVPATLPALLAARAGNTGVLDWAVETGTLPVDFSTVFGEAVRHGNTAVIRWIGENIMSHENQNLTIPAWNLAVQRFERCDSSGEPTDLPLLESEIEPRAQSPWHTAFDRYEDAGFLYSLPETFSVPNALPPPLMWTPTYATVMRTEDPALGDDYSILILE